jgi:DNA-binding NtrC family response regulator/tetratricopeptide (TPR) repeat protein
MKEFPYHHYQVIEKLKHSAAASTFVVKPNNGVDNSLILKLYTGTTARPKPSALEDDLRWQRGLAHPHLLGITTAGVSGKNSFFTTRQFSSELLDLSKVNQTNVTHLLDAVCFLHKHGRPHGRIKPSNIFSIQGSVQLADMRIVDSVESSSFDDIRFTAPEVLLGGAPTIESDCYSLGAILYRIYARRDPFDDSLPENLKAKYLQARIPTVRERSGIRGALAAAIDGMLHRNPRRRVDAIRELIREMPFAAESPSRVPMIGRRDTFEQLYSRISATTTRSLTVEMIEGDAGIGKSRLIEELQFRCVFYNSEFYCTACIERTEPNLAPIVRLVRMLLYKQCSKRRIGVRALLGTFEDNLAPLFVDIKEQSPGGGSDHPSERVVQDLIGLIAFLSRKEPLRLCIEDIDKAGPATKGFIRQLCYRASELNVRLILTCRNSAAAILPCEIEDFLGRDFSRLFLGPLERSESLDLSRYLESNPGKQKQILSRAGGSPLWLLEHARIGNTQALTKNIYEAILAETLAESHILVRALAAIRGPATADLLARVSSESTQTIKPILTQLKSIGAVYEANESYEMRSDDLRNAIAGKVSTREMTTIHGSIYRALKLEKGVTEERLADHAYFGGCWDQAAVHLGALAQSAAKCGDNVAALSLYRKLGTVHRKLKQKLPIEAEIGAAVCFSKIGKPKKAEAIFQRLLTESDINEDLRIPLSLLSSGGEIDCSHQAQRLRFLQDAIESSASEKMHPSILLGKLSGAFVTAGDFARAADVLKRAQESLERIPDSEGQAIVTGSEAYLLISKSSFRAASDKYQSLTCRNWGMAAAALTNQAFCLEHLGNIQSATVIQKRALRLASKAGLLVGQFLCLGNLGAFNTKLGNFQESQEFFRKMRQLVSEVGPNAGISFKGGEVEEALFEFLKGRYTSAIHGLRSALNSASLFGNIRLQCQLLQFEIFFSLGTEVKGSEINQIASESSWSESPLFAVQLALLRSRTKPTVSEALSVLEDAMETARKAGLLYEVCRLEIETADRLCESDTSDAKFHADEALRISKKNGYRPLQCRALLLRALNSRHAKEREHYLGLCLKLATSVGIPEIVSESSYHLGVHYESTNQTSASRECFANSTRVTSEIAEQIPAKFRSAYLARPWRKDARRRYEEQLLDQPLRLHSAETDPGFRDHHYFRALYRISIAASSSRTTDEFLRGLLPAIGLAREGIVAMLTLDGHTSWHSHGVVLTDALRHRVLSLAVKARGQARYNSNDRWIPFRSALHSGGICVLSRKKNQMGEEEMEFFTILGIFASSALDQIHNRIASTPAPVSIDAFHGIVGSSRSIRDLCAHIARISNNSATVLIQGETGTGKELVARAIHKLSSRSKGPFIPIDCGAISEGLLESELFGSKRGSFTGAIADRPGVFEAAHTGTLFLDEISNMNLAMQAKLLRVLQEKEIRRVGETRNRLVDVRLVAASNANLKQLAAEGSFRQDLLFRLNVIAVSIPPLRSRREDIPMLASYFLKQLNSAHKAGKVLGPKALDPLLTHHFPGNVRELQNCVERGYFTTSGKTIVSIPIDSSAGEESVDEVRKWLADLADGRRNFWTEIHDRYKRRDISREKVVALIDLGLRTTRGSYKNLASLLHIQEREYRRLMDFLRRNNCLLDFRPYRKVASLS